MSPTSTGASAVEVSGSTGIIIGVIIGVILALVLALLILYRRCRDMRRKLIVVTPAAVAPAKPSSTDGKSCSTSSTSSSSDKVSSLALSEGASASAKARMTRAQALLRTFELDAHEIRTFEKLGEGGQAVVVRGWWDGTEVAIKQPKGSFNESRGEQNAFGSTSAHDSFNQRSGVRCARSRACAIQMSSSCTAYASSLHR